MTTTLPIIAFADDVCCLNANLADSKLAWIAPQYGLVGKISLPMTAKPVVPRTNLYAHGATFTIEGQAKLAAAASTDSHARRLRLSEGETFGLLLAHWRDFYGSLCDGMTDKPSGPQYSKFARYKIEQAKSAGDMREAKRLASVLTAMQAELRDEKQANCNVTKSMRQSTTLTIC
jgi:hypothetical protein